MPILPSFLEISQIGRPMSNSIALSDKSHELDESHDLDRVRYIRPSTELELSQSNHQGQHC
jgi:hypothetical protein